MKSKQKRLTDSKNEKRMEKFMETISKMIDFKVTFN